MRGAPAIAIVGSLSLGVELLNTDFDDVQDITTHISKKLQYLVSARPTAVNMKEAADRYTKLANKSAIDESATVESIKKK